MITISDGVFAKFGEDGIYHRFTWTTVMPILDSQVGAYDAITRAATGRYSLQTRGGHWLGLVPRCVIWRMWASNIM